MRIMEMKIVEDEAAQSSAEYVLLLGGIIVIVLVAVIAYKNYVNGLGSELNNSNEMSSVNGNLTLINDTLKGT